MTSPTDHLNAIRRYYDETDDLYLRYVGRSYQAGVLKGPPKGEDPFRATNLYCAGRAGIASGHRVLDAGCGSCGPSIDIATAIDGVRIDAITLSPVQAASARRFIDAANLSERIAVHVGDYHALPFDAGTFDVVFYLESTGHSPNPAQLFREAWRVLKPGGRLYVKDMYRPDGLSADGTEALAELDRVFVLNTRSLAEDVAFARAAGFEDVEGHDLQEQISVARFVAARYDWVSVFPVLNDFGRYHTYQRPVTPLPAVFGELRGWKPTPAHR